MIDTHLHLHGLPDPGEVADEAVGVGVTTMITMGVDDADDVRAVELAQAHPAVFAGVGHHPVNRQPPNWARIRVLAEDPRVVALGEVGLDGAHQDSPIEEQMSWLHRFCELSGELDLPLSIHAREATGPVLEVLAAHPGIRGVMHYFSLDWEWAERFLGLGLHLSFSGLITRPSRASLREVVRRCPAERLLLETDTPYGTPHVYRGQSNRPAWLMETAEVVAELRGIDLAQLAKLELDNVRGLFSRIVC